VHDKLTNERVIIMKKVLSVIMAILVFLSVFAVLPVANYDSIEESDDVIHGQLTPLWWWRFSRPVQWIMFWFFFGWLWMCGPRGIIYCRPSVRDW